MRTKFFSFALTLLITLPLISACATKPQAVVTGPVTLNFYGLDSSDVWAPIINAYKKRQPTVTIRYKKFDDRGDYENVLLNEIAEGAGPDVAYLHNTWLPYNVKKLTPLASQSLTPDTFGTAFVSIAQDDLVIPDPKDGAKKIFGIPLYIDTLALYYNQDHYEKALPEKGKPGTTWSEVKKDSSSLRQLDDVTGVVTRGSIAIGRSDSVSLSADILWNFIVQGGVPLFDTDFKQAAFAQNGQKYFDEFLAFAEPKAKEYGWDASLTKGATDDVAPEVEAFISGKVSSMVGYARLKSSFEAATKAVKGKNLNPVPASDIKVAPIPQYSADEATWKVIASYDVLSVPRNSKNSTIAWDFIQFAASKDMSNAYLSKTKLPAARRDLVEAQKKDPFLAVFVGQLGSAVSVKEVSEQRYTAIMNEAIDDASNGMSSRTALSNAQSKINEIMKLQAPQGLYPKPPVVKK